MKGYIDRNHWSTQDTHDQVSGRRTNVLAVHSLETGKTEQVNIEDAKAIFFVRSFEGPNDRPDLRFHDHLPPPECLWIRLVFIDGEILEGMIENGVRYVNDPGFFVTPSDPTANNWLIYIPKQNIRDFEVLGLRQRTATKLASLP